MKPTLSQVFALSVLTLCVVLTLLFALVFRASRSSILASAESMRETVSKELAYRVTGFLEQAPQTVDLFQEELTRGIVEPSDASALERTLLSLLLARGDIGEVSFTYGRQSGFDAQTGEMLLEAQPRGQWSVVRTTGADGAEQIWSRHLHQVDGRFVADRRMLSIGAEFMSPATEKTLQDPTQHRTFTTPAQKDLYGELVWSDLHWSQLDEDLPEDRRRIEVSVQRVVKKADGKFAGVLRVGLLAQQLDRALQFRIAPEGESDLHRIFLCDAQRRLITRTSANDRIQDFDGDLRVAPASLPPVLASALATPALGDVGEDKDVASGEFRLQGAEYLTTFRKLPETQDWIVGIVVPRAFYLGNLTAMRNQLLVASLAIMALLVAGGAFVMRAVRRAQGRIVHETVKMNRFNFAPAPTASPFRDVSDILENLERAKTAVRAMGKYVPLELVRRLYQERSEPVLGGEDREISIMFTDIRGFTSFSEELAPAVLADALGRYLDLMAGIIQRETGGTIDKYIGNAIMTLWNAPQHVTDHARRACLAALRCRDAGNALSASPEWSGLPPFETRFGLHCGEALVGHFGAHDRMNYTAIGDAVNLASRLESLNKQYGTTIIASEQIVARAGEKYEFRLLDLVAVKGKTQPTRIYELLGIKGERPSAAESYEAAFAAYNGRDFVAAIAILEKQTDDPPSAALLKRCREYLEEPPEADWRGVYHLTAK